MICHADSDIFFDKMGVKVLELPDNFSRNSWESLSGSGDYKSNRMFLFNYLLLSCSCFRLFKTDKIALWKCKSSCAFRADEGIA